MGYASQSGRARTSAKKPQAFAVCMRCGMWENRVNLQFQWDWRGNQLQNLYLLVCKECLDEPQEQLRAIVLPADPVPIFYPSVENFEQDETSYHTVNAVSINDPVTGIPVPAATLLVTENCENVTQQPTGEPNGLEQDAVMPWNGTAAYRVPLAVFSVNSNGSTDVTVTCSAVHNLQTNSQVAIAGLTNPEACGFFSVTVTTATAFTYQTTNAIPASSLITPTTLILTALVGLPYGYEQIP